MNATLHVTTLGQSLWLDNLSRSLIRDGTLARLIAEDGVSGVTSNPSIFQNALASSPYYADDLARLKASEPDVERRYEALVIPDIRDACDLLLPVFERSGGNDGYVSLEVAPRWAYDAARTVAEAQRLSAAVDRRNLLIKVPGTHEGLSAFEIADDARHQRQRNAAVFHRANPGRVRRLSSAALPHGSAPAPTCAPATRWRACSCRASTPWSTRS